MVRVKICGIRTDEEARLACELGADAVGFIFASSPRRVTPEEARRIARKIPPFIIRVGVFVDEALEEIERVMRFTGLDVVQLHGQEPPDYIPALRWAVIKAVSVPRHTRGEEAENRLRESLARYRASAAILLDTCAGGKVGGSGQTFDWSLARMAVREGYRVILAGGLTPENVQAAVKEVRPYGVDVASGVEEGGRKDARKMALFIQAAKGLSDDAAGACMRAGVYQAEAGRAKSLP